MEFFNSDVPEMPGKAAAKQTTPRLRRFAQLSGARQALVRLCQATNYGQILHLEIRDGDPVLDSPPLVLIDVKLDADEVPRPEVDLPDFELSSEVRRLVDQLQELFTGNVERIEVRAGIPRRIVFRRPPINAQESLHRTAPPDRHASEGVQTGVLRP